jgi:hypothetical protein
VFDPTIQIDLGRQRYDVENEPIFGALENSTWVTGVLAGFQITLRDRWILRYAAGYQSASAASSVVYPLPFLVGLAARFP